MTALVLAPGPLTTVQDGGRPGYRSLGVGLAGALDADALAVANLLVGNRGDAPVLEFTLAGPTLRFLEPACIALVGAHCDARAGTMPVPCDRPVELPAGCELHVGRCQDSARGVLAVAGGWSVPTVLGSASTDLRGGFGGFEGRALAAGDRLLIDRTSPTGTDAVRIAPWWVEPVQSADPAFPVTVHVLAGHDATEPVDALSNSEWQVAAASNRQGLRLQGKGLRLPADALPVGERVSEPVAPGTIQLPADGQPIVLLADAQSHGGYPRIGHVALADLPRLARLRPGDSVRFLPCTHATAARLHRERSIHLARLALAVGRMREGGGR